MKLGFRLVLILILLACFCIQVWDGFLKFVKRQTTIVSKASVSSTFRLPAISFCPGYKDYGKDYDERSEEMDNLLEDTEDDRTPMDIWLNDTYSIEEVLDSIQAPGPWHETPQVVLNDTGFYPGPNVTLHEVSTGYGRCYAIHFSGYLLTHPNDFFTLRFNMTRHNELFLYIHEDYDEIGQHWGYYPILPTQAIVVKNAHYTMSVKNNLFKPFNNVGCKEDAGYSYPKCVVKWAQARYLQMFVENGRTACWVPDTQYYANASNIMECPTKEEADWARTNTYSQVSEQLDGRTVTKCARRCVRNNLVVTTLREPDHSDESTRATYATYIYYGGIFEANKDEEVMLYDFNNIVAAIGGSLGLLLGVSVFSIIVHISDRCGDFASSEKLKWTFRKNNIINQIKVV